MAVLNKADFADLRDDFKNYLQEQDEFTDYDLTQSGLDVIINLMSYGIHYDFIQANFSNTEMFLSTAQLRKNVTSRAKHLMYRPKSVVAARAIIDLEIEETSGNTLPNTLFLPKGTKFVTTDTLTEAVPFVTTSSYIATKTGSTYTFPEIPIFQGSYTTTTATYKNGYSIEIPNDTIDISTVEVYVQENPNSTQYTKYSLLDNIINAKPDSKIFYLEENYNSLYEIYFGDGILGTKVADGSRVMITYIVSSGSEGNSFSAFAFAKSPNPVDQINKGRGRVLVRERSTGGAARESIESIKFNAPKFFTTQRIILNDVDANNVIPHEYPDIKSVNIWSGKGSGAFGKTYISLNPYYDNLPQTRIDEIIREVEAKRFVIMTELEYVAPSYIDLNVKLNVYFDGSINIDQIEKDLYTQILNYSEENIEDFKKKFISSKFIQEINADNLDYDFFLEIIDRVPIFVNSLEDYTFDFKNEITGLKTNTFIWQGGTHYITNVGNDLVLINDVGTTMRTVGSVNLTTGTGSITEINIQSISDNILEVKASPKRESVFAYNNTILRILEKDIQITYESIES